MKPAFFFKHFLIWLLLLVINIISIYATIPSLFFVWSSVMAYILFAAVFYTFCYLLMPALYETKKFVLLTLAAPLLFVIFLGVDYEARNFLRLVIEEKELEPINIAYTLSRLNFFFQYAVLGTLYYFGKNAIKTERQLRESESLLLQKEKELAEQKILTAEAAQQAAEAKAQELQNHNGILFNTINTITQQQQSITQIAEILNRTSVTPNGMVTSSFIFARIDRSITRVIPAEYIYYIEADNNYTILYHILPNMQLAKTMVANSLKEMESFLPNYFRRTHRSYIVNMNKVYQFDKTEVQLLHINSSIPISEKYLPAFMGWFSAEP